MIDFRRWFVAAAVAVLSLGLGVLRVRGPEVLAASPVTAASANEQIVVQSAPTQYLISTFAGGLPGPTSAVATTYTPGEVTAVVADRFGNTYAASSLHCVFRLDPAGLLTRVAGTCRPGYSGDGASAVNAQLNNPQGLALDPSGNLYIADQNNQRIRMVSPNGTITTFAGTGTAGYNGDNKPATSAELYYPAGIAVDSSGNLYIADQNNQRIRKVTSGPTPTITTIAGSGLLGLSDTGAATTAQFYYPQGVAVDPSGNVYIADTQNNKVLKLAAGSVTAFAGNGTVGSGNAQLNYPKGLALDYSGNLYIADSGNSRVQKVTGGTITTFAGGNSTSLGDNGPAISAQINSPQSVAVDISGNVYITDQNYRLRKVNGSGIITTVAGTGAAPFSGDGGQASLAQFGGNWGLAADPGNNLYIADPVGNRVRKITPAGIVSTFAGNGNPGDSGDGNPATSAAVTPTSVASDSVGNIYLGDSAIVRKVALNGVITTVAGTGVAGSATGEGGPATAARLSAVIRGLAVDSNGNLYIADTNNSCVRKVTAGTITTVAGIPGQFGFSGDGLQGTAAKLGFPGGLAVDSAGDLYIADTQNLRVRELTAASGLISTVAGGGGSTGDGIPATAADLSSPVAVALDASGNLYIAGGGNAVQVVSGGDIYTIAGTGVAAYTGDGGPAPAGQLVNPYGLAVISGNVYVSDNAVGAVRILSPVGVAPLLTASVTDNGPFTLQQNGAAYTITVTNAAAAVSTSSAVTVADPIPAGLTLSSMGGVGWNCPGSTCTSTGVLSNGNNYPIDLTVSVASNALPQVTNLVTVTGGGSPGYSALDSTFVGPGVPVLEISSTHAGDFLVGQNNATYLVTVGNEFSALPTTGQVTVSEVLPPSGLSFVSMTSSDNSWVCSGPSCTRSNALQGGGVYPPITVTVDVTATQPGQVTNQVTVSGGGSASATFNDVTLIAGAGCAQNGTATVADVQVLINQALGTDAPSGDLNKDGVVNIVDVQIVINAALGLGCTT